MIATNGIPRQHEFWMGINTVVIGGPQGVAHTSHAIEMVDVAGGYHTLYAYGSGKIAHEFGDGLL